VYDFNVFNVSGFLSVEFYPHNLQPIRSRDLSPCKLFLVLMNKNIGCLPFTPKIRKFRMECKWKDQFCLPERKFSRENGISWKVDQNSQTEFPNGKCAFHLLVFTGSRSFGYLSGKSRGNKTSAFPFGIWRVLFTTVQLSTNQFFRVNGKQP